MRYKLKKVKKSYSENYFEFIGDIFSEDIMDTFNSKKKDLEKRKKSNTPLAVTSGNDTTDAYNQAKLTYYQNHRDIFGKGPKDFKAIKRWKDYHIPHFFRDKVLEPLKGQLKLDDIKHQRGIDTINSITGSNGNPNFSTSIFSNMNHVVNSYDTKRKLFGVNTDKKKRDAYMTTLVNDMRREVDGETAEDLSLLFPKKSSFKGANIGDIIYPGIGRVANGPIGRKKSLRDYIDDPSLVDDNGEIISLSQMTPEQKAEYRAAKHEFKTHNLMNSKIDPGRINSYNPMRGEFDDSLKNYYREKRKNATLPITPEALNAPILHGLKANKDSTDSGIKLEKLKIPKIKLKY